MTTLTSEEERTILTYDKIADNYARARSEIILWQTELNTLKEMLPAGRLLEIGAGGGRDAAELIRMGYDYTGIEPSGGLLAIAQGRNPGAQLVQKTIYELNNTNKFDGFWCTAVLLHIPRNRIDEALQAIHRNVKSGAVGFITIKEGIGEQRHSQLGNEDSRVLFVYWDNEAFKATLVRNGYEVIQESRRSYRQSDWLMYHVRAV